MFNLPGFGSEDTQELTLFDSEKEGGAIAPGQSKEKYISLTTGRYQITAHRGRLSDTLNQIRKNYDSATYGYLCLDLFTESGQRIASSRDAFTLPFQMVNFIISENLELKLNISRNGGTDRNSIHFYVDARYSPKIFYIPATKLKINNDKTRRY